MGSIVVNPKGFMTGLDHFVERFHTRWAQRMAAIMHFAMDRLTARTPVYTGRAVRNYVASIGKPYAGPAMKGFRPVEATNPLRLGAEQLRDDATRDAKGTLKGLRFDTKPFSEFYITNRASNISGLEAGELPLDPLQQRSPKGMFAVTLDDIITKLEQGGFGRL
jgi:hypothetical protein